MVADYSSSKAEIKAFFLIHPVVIDYGA